MCSILSYLKVNEHYLLVSRALALYREQDKGGRGRRQCGLPSTWRAAFSDMSLFWSFQHGLLYLFSCSPPLGFCLSLKSGHFSRREFQGKDTFPLSFGTSSHLLVYRTRISFLDDFDRQVCDSTAVKSMKIPRRLEGKVAVITASTAGIGLGIAERLGLEGASVVISSRKQKNVDAASAQLKAKGIDAIGMACHVNNAEQRKNLIKTTMDKYGRLDILVSNAAANPTIDTITTMKESNLDKLWETNVKAGILLVQEAVPHMKRGSSIVFISSYTGFNPVGGGLQMYAVTKTTLLGLTKALASELGPEIRVNCVCPGFVPTHFADFLIKDKEIRKEHEEATILNRLGTPGDMAAAVAYLVSDDASYVTGENLCVAGGLQSRL